MGSLYVDGNILQPEGAVVVDGGALTVTGDYRFQSKNSDGTYGESNGALGMHNEEDYVKVQGRLLPRRRPLTITIRRESGWMRSLRRAPSRSERDFTSS